MDLDILKKKISTFRGSGGRVRGVNDELLMEILIAWENWTGPSLGFYKSIGVSQKGMASMLGKAKKLKREGHFPVEEFKEVILEESSLSASSDGTCGIEVFWDNGKIIRFSQVDYLVDFLKKVETKVA